MRITLINLLRKKSITELIVLAGFDKGRTAIGTALLVLLLLVCFPGPALWSSGLPSSGLAASELFVQPYFIIFGNGSVNPLAGASGYSPAQIKNAYNLPSTGGIGTTIAIIDAYDDPTVSSDLTFFSNYFGLTPVNFTEIKMPGVTENSGWSPETSLDTQWAHAIAPNATILLVEAKSSSVADLMAAVTNATSQPNVVAVSMSWGASESSILTQYDSDFALPGVTFFASSGDSGSNGGTVSWPASSPNVVGVGGTTLKLTATGAVISETAWGSSGGGVSTVWKEPSYQLNYNVSITGGYRGVPDVSYDADPSTGVPVYDTTAPSGYNNGWNQIGGTSAGSPQWAAIQALGRSTSNPNFYTDAKSSSYSSYFRDIISGNNGIYSAGPGYDLVTGLGSPLTTNYLPPASPNSTVHLLLTVGPNQAAYSRGQSLNLDVSVLNQLGAALNSTLTLTITGPNQYYHYDLQPITVKANNVTDYSFSWTVPNTGGTYTAEVGLAPAQLTAYDAVWLNVS